jgi:two-component system, NarL family, sensor histidine kinase LiaS
MLLPERLHFLFPSRWRTLRARLTVSYFTVTFGSVLLFIVLTALARGALVSLFSDTSVPTDFTTQIARQAETYAMMASLESSGEALDPRSSFNPGLAHTIAVANLANLDPEVVAPYVTDASQDPTSVAIALLIAPDGDLVASSYPARYPAGLPVFQLSTRQRQAIDQALSGQASTGTEAIASVELRYAAEPVWSNHHQLAPNLPPIGAILLQVPVPVRDGLLSSLWNSLSGSLTVLLLVTPAGVFFGWITARGLVSRVRRLVQVTTQFTAGDYADRITVTHDDEIGQLERQFNQMAEQMRENILRRQRLAEENARLEERSRISRELHDAVSQDLFSLRMLADGLQEAASAGSSSADLRPHIALLEQATGSMTREMRTLLLELRSSELENLGLVGALQKLASTYSARLGINVATDLQPVVVDVKAEHALLRIAQESLSNAARHARASRVSLSLAYDTGNALLVVSDNGDGFTAPDGSAGGSSDGNGLGLRIMRERVEALHGTFELRTAPGLGTRIAVALPGRENTDD